jgi:hypothetical protein
VLQHTDPKIIHGTPRRSGCSNNEHKYLWQSSVRDTQLLDTGLTDL